MHAAVGLAIWAQYWFWFPMMHFMKLALQPTALIGLNKDLKMPKSFGVKCDAKPSFFAYAKHLEEKKEEKKELVVTAILSTTAKAKARQEKRDAKNGTGEGTSDAMEVEESKMVEEKKTEEEEEVVPEVKKVVPEPTFFLLDNPARVTTSQEPFLSLEPGQRYVPIVARVRQFIFPIFILNIL